MYRIIKIIIILTLAYLCELVRVSQLSRSIGSLSNVPYIIIQLSKYCFLFIIIPGALIWKVRAARREENFFEGRQIFDRENLLQAHHYKRRGSEDSTDFSD
ncbi:hypothetical protein FGO68_gene13781 [Halteria grandinella]|uniref:Uncharacterized protein n=1 Tax=Halteria grandinella TaxID=5974 RepID=A0A8J8NIL5_HALGN|nr:hypothetical protein FGO68_gene13781 [Halteria grandinella]